MKGSFSKRNASKIAFIIPFFSQQPKQNTFNVEWTKLSDHGWKV